MEPMMTAAMMDSGQMGQRDWITLASQGVGGMAKMAGAYLSEQERIRLEKEREAQRRHEWNAEFRLMPRRLEQTDRNQNMNGLGFLAQERDAAERASRLRTFKNMVLA